MYKSEFIYLEINIKSLKETSKSLKKHGSTHSFKILVMSPPLPSALHNLEILLL